EHLVSLLSLFFDDVTCFGIDGDDVLKADFAARRASGERLLKLDPLDLRKRIPHRTYVWAYEHILPLTYKVLGRGNSGIGSGIDAELGGIEVLRRPRKMGLGSAYRAGHAIGIARGYDVMIQIDADLSHDPAALPSLLAAIEDGADLAIGSRYVPGGTVPNWPKR